MTSKNGNGRPRLLRRLAREAPELVIRWAQGEIPSVTRAAIQAGFVRQPTRIELAERTIARLSREERIQLWRRRRTVVR